MQMFDPASTVIFWGTMFLFFGVVGRYLAQLLHQPPVLGELMMGVVLGNVCYACHIPMLVVIRDIPAIFSIVQHLLAGVSLPDSVHSVISDPAYARRILTVLSQKNSDRWVQVTYVVDMFSRYGVIFLLFMVGLDSSINELKKTGKESFFVASIGVIAPVILGMGILPWFIPHTEFRALLFVSATLCATSVGITARVFRDLHQLQTREVKTILGAAMIDDVMGLILLAIVSSLVIHDGLQWFAISQTIVFACLFFPIALTLGPRLLRYMLSAVSFLEPWEAKVLVSFVFLMGFSWFATLVQMSSIIGAFVAGIVLHDGFFISAKRELMGPPPLKQLMSPFEAIFAPLFFVLIGIQVRLETFFDWHVLWTAVVLVMVAIVGKLLSGLGANKRDNRLLIGVGMMPRGEVGLIFASVGKTIGVIPDTLFSAIILMVVVTTLITPIWIKKLV